MSEPTTIAAAPPRKTTGRLSREDWLAGALDTLIREGEVAFRIDQLARRLGVTKGSFYWHFRSRDEFRQAVALYWMERFTNTLLPRVRAAGGDARARLRTLMTVLLDEEVARYEVAVRAWALQDGTIADVVRRTDEHRLEIVRELLGELGFEGDELEVRARVFVTYESFELGLFTPETDERRRSTLDRRLDFFTRPA